MADDVSNTGDQLEEMICIRLSLQIILTFLGCIRLGTSECVDRKTKLDSSMSVRM